MPGQGTCAPPVIVTFPARLDAATADQAAGRITAALTPGVSVVIADLAAAAYCDRSAIRYLLKAHRHSSRVGDADPVGAQGPSSSGDGQV